MKIELLEIIDEEFVIDDKIGYPTSFVIHQTPLPNYPYTAVVDIDGIQKKIGSFYSSLDEFNEVYIRGNAVYRRMISFIKANGVLIENEMLNLPSLLFKQLDIKQLLSDCFGSIEEPSINLSESIIDSFQCEYAKIGKRSNFSKVYFGNDCRLKNTIFANRTSFKGSYFGSTSMFDHCSFMDDVYFSDSHFEQSTHFNNSKFHGNANFSDCYFAPKCNFDESTFYSSVEFRRTIFSDYCSINFTKFKRDAIFIGAKFEDYISFWGAEFDVSNFRDSSFGIRTRFEHAIINASACFDLSKFGIESSFAGTSFKNSASFHSAYFSEGMQFIDSHFNGYASFQSATFKNGVTFNKSKFLDTTQFDKSEFGDVSFNTTVFSSNVSFANCLFHGNLGLDNLDFRKMSFAYSKFKNTSFIGQFNPISLASIDFTGVDLVVDKQMDKAQRKDAYRNLKLLFNQLGDYDEEDHAYAEFRKYQALENRGKFSFHPLSLLKCIKWFIIWLLFDAIGGYGTRPTRVFGWMLFTYLLFTALFFGIPELTHNDLLSGDEQKYIIVNVKNVPITQPMIHKANIISDLSQKERIGKALYHSGVTFLTIGYGDLRPCTGLGVFLSIMEGFCGLFLMSYLTIAFSRKVLR
jgi:hypothetical protein